MNKLRRLRSLSPEMAETLRLAGVQGIFWAAMAVGNYQTVYLQSIGFPATDFGLLNAIACAVAIFAMTFWGTVSDRIGDYKKLLEDYNAKVLKRDKLALQDTVIIRISLRCIDRISAEGKGLYRSVSDLVLYATGAAACSTSDLMLVLESINTSLDNIKKLLNAAYFDTWRYIQVRIGYWKESIYTPQNRSQILDGAFKRWRESGLNPYRNRK